MTPQAKQELDNTVRIQQLKVNSRLTALQAAQALMSLQSFDQRVCHQTLIAMAGDIEKYILGTLEDETKEALEKVKSMSNVRPIMRP